jgi:hypothetical protein
MVDFTLAAEDEVLVLAALTVLEEKLPLIALSKTEIRRTSHFGQKNETFVMEAIEAGKQNPTLIPPNVSMTAVDRDLAGRDKLQAIALRVERLNEKLVHTRRALGADLYGAARAIYKALQEFGRDAGVAETVDRLALRFKRQGRKASEDTTIPNP